MFTDETKNIDDNYSDEIDLSLVWQSILRGKIFIFLFVLLSTLTGTMYSLVAKQIWQGSFNIVIKDVKSTDGDSSNSINPLSSILTGSLGESDETQRLILKSPSVLMPVYEYVKEYSIKNKIDLNQLTFKQWVEEDLVISYKKGSTVLNVKYQNSDKDLILDVLNLISSKYKNYSKKDQEKTLTKTRNYLENQQKLMEKKSSESNKKFNKFSIQHGLGNIDGFIGLGNAQMRDNSQLNSVDISKIRRNPILSLNSDQFKFDMENSNESAGQRYKSQFAKLELYEAKYTDLSANLKPNSQTLLDLKSKIKTLRSSLKRPNEILITYNELSKASARDSQLLRDIEYNLELIKLEQIRTPDAWEMISVPSIDKNRVFPQRKLIVALSFLGSTLLGVIITLVKEKLSDKIFNQKEISQKLQCKHLETLMEDEQNINSQLVDLIVQKYNNSIGLINYNSNSNSKIINEILGKNIKLVDLKNKKIIGQFDNLILIIEKGKIKNSEITTLNKYISIFKEKFIGWIYIDTI